MNKKIVSLLILSVLACTLIMPLIPNVSASTVTLYTNVSSKTDGMTLLTYHPSVNGSNSAFFSVFTATATGYLSGLEVSMTKNNMVITNWAGGMEAYLTTYTGTIADDNAYPNTELTNPTTDPEVLSTSSLVICNSVSSTAYQNVFFSFPRDYQVVSGQSYAIVVALTSCSGDGANDGMHFSRGNSDVATESYGYYHDGAYYNSASYSLYCIIYGDTVAAPTPTPAATPTPTPTNDYKWDENTNSWSWWNGTHWIPSSGPSPTANAQIVTFTGNMITYIVPLCLLLLPAIVGAWALGRAGAAKWGFIAGLNIGAIMCYLYLPSFGLWAVIAIVVVDVLMIFASQRGSD